VLDEIFQYEAILDVTSSNIISDSYYLTSSQLQPQTMKL